MIQAIFVIEMMGKPSKYLKKTLTEYIEKIQTEKVKILRKEVAKPKKVNDDLFSAFAEIEVETQDILEILKILFTYMPSHVEVIKPESFSLKNADFNSIANEILIRLHKYDEVAKAIIMQKNALEAQLKQLGIEPITSQMQPQNQNLQESKKKNSKKKK